MSIVFLHFAHHYVDGVPLWARVVYENGEDVFLEDKDEIMAAMRQCAEQIKQLQADIEPSSSKYEYGEAA